jgi:hypothetical protein
MNEIQMLAIASAVNRGAYRTLQVERQKVINSIQESNATILGYDSVIGQYKIKKPNGDINSTIAISNSGALAKGSQVSLTTPAGGTPIIDTMPRG